MPGLTIIRKCSACSKAIKQDTIASGNTFGAMIWTDGKRIAPMLPDQPWLVMCPHCHAPLWLDELEVLGVTAPRSAQNTFSGALRYEFPSVNDYFSVLESGVAELKKIRYIRLRAWWAGNDIRRTKEAEVKISAREEENLIAFAEILDEANTNDLVMKAEVMRELGRFDDATALLTKVNDNDLSQAIEIIKLLAEKSDPYVRRMCFK